MQEVQEQAKSTVVEQGTSLDFYMKQLQIRVSDQMSTAERELVISKIFNNFGGKCNLLVFGLGNDSPFWSLVNMHGYTHFIENHPGWTKKVTERRFIHPDVVSIADYYTRADEFEEDIAEYFEKGTVKGKDPFSILSEEDQQKIKNTEWDIVLVDAPFGAISRSKIKPQNPGRVLSAIIAKELNPHFIYLHDCNRKVEQYIVNVLYSDKDKVEVDRTFQMT